jgi:ketosteroid isomerase-like protein
MNLRSVPEDVLSQVMTKELVFHLERRNFAVIQAVHMSESGLVAAVRQCGALADGVEWVVPGPAALPFAGTWKGIEGLWNLERHLARAVRVDTVELARYLVSGNDVAAFFTLHAYARATGRPFRTEVLRLYTLEEGRIVRIHSAYDTNAVVEAMAPLAPPQASETLHRSA